MSIHPQLMVKTTKTAVTNSGLSIDREVAEAQKVVVDRRGEHHFHGNVFSVESGVELARVTSSSSPLSSRSIDRKRLTGLFTGAATVLVDAQFLIRRVKH